MKTSSPHEGNLRDERIRFSGEHFFGGSSCDFRCHRSHEETCTSVFKNHEPTRVP